MRGLILKDIYCVRIIVILSLLLALLPNLMFLFMGGGMTVEYLGTPNEIFAYLPIGLINFITIGCFGTISLNTIKYDDETGWNKYQLTLPISADRIILSKQISCVAVVLMLTLCCYVPNVFSMVIFGADAEIMLTMPLIFGMLEMICVLAALPLSLRYGTKTADMIVIVYILLLGAALILGMGAAISAGVSSVIIRLVLYIALPLLTAVVGYLTNRSARKLLVNVLEEENA